MQYPDINLIGSFALKYLSLQGKYNQTQHTPKLEILIWTVNYTFKMFDPALNYEET